MGKRSRSRSPKDKKSKRKNSSNSSERAVKKDKHSKKNGKLSRIEDKHESPFTMETRSKYLLSNYYNFIFSDDLISQTRFDLICYSYNIGRKNSDVAEFNDG
jgi:hypothetical protein